MPLPASTSLEKTLSVSQAARFLDVSVNTLRNWDTQGKLKASRTGGNQRRYPLPELEEFVHNRLLPPLPSSPSLPQALSRTPKLGGLRSFLRVLVTFSLGALATWIVLSTPKVRLPKPSLSPSPPASSRADFTTILAASGGKYQGDVEISGEVTITGQAKFEEQARFVGGARFGSSTLTIDTIGNLTTDQKITTQDLEVKGVLTADGSGLTKVKAANLDGLSKSDFLRSNTTDDAEARITFTAAPEGTGVGQGALYINPSGTIAADRTLLGIAVAGSQRVRFDSDGDLGITGNLSLDGNVTKGTWQGTAVGVAYGGTGATTLNDLITLGTHTTGNYVASITAGSGVSGSSSAEGGTPTIALGALTADWNQTGAFDIQLNNASSELKILESAGATYYGTIDAGDLGADRTLTIPNVAGTIATIDGGQTFTSAVWNGTAITDTYVADTLTIDSSSAVTWTALTTYPTACASGQAVQAVGDTLTCLAVSSSWSGLTDPTANLTLAHGSNTTTFNWTDFTGNSNFFSFNFDNNGGTAGTDQGIVISNAVSTATTGDLNTEALLVLDQADTITTGTTVVDDALLITNSGGSTLTDAIQIGTGTQAIGTGIRFGSTGITTDLVLQNGETIDNDTDGRVTVTGNLNFTGTFLEDGNEILANMIAPFASSCPTGWTEYTAARGRSVVGTPASGTIASTVGTALTNLEDRTHTHTGPSHAHTVTTTTIGDGAGAERHAFTSANPSTSSSGTGATGTAATSNIMPYIQLTYCQKTAGADLAEWIGASEDIREETIVSVDPDNNEKVIASRIEYDPTVVGIIATKPGWLIGSQAPASVQMALAGRVPTRVSLVNGEIKRGDPITTSSIAGVGMKASREGAIIGKAMEPLTRESALVSCESSYCGTITVFVNVSWHRPSEVRQLADEGGYNPLDETIYLTSLDDSGNVGSPPTPDLPLTQPTVDITPPPVVDAGVAIPRPTDSVIIPGVGNVKEALDSLSKQLADLRTEQASISALLAGHLPGEVANEPFASLTVLGKSLLSDTAITGKLTVGLLSFDDLEGSINSLGGTLKLGELATPKLNLTDSAGTATVPSGQTSLTVAASQVKSTSLVFLTPVTTAVAVAVPQVSPAESFTITISQPLPIDLVVNWWIVN